MKKILLSIFAVAILNGCKGNGERIQPTQSNDDFHVEFLFEADGVKVYRFYDAGNYVYFTNTNGKCGYTQEREPTGYDDIDRLCK